MENRAYALSAGVFVVLLAALLIAGTVWLSGRTVQGVPYILVSEQSVAGLVPSAMVRLRGVAVGKVEGIGFDPLDARRVLVRILVDPSVELRQDSYATLSFLGVTGSAFVELDDDRRTQAPLASSSTSPARIPLRASWLSQLSDSSVALVNTATQTLRRLDGVLSNENAEHLSRLLAQLDAGSAGISALASELRPAARRLDSLVADSDEAIRSARPVLRNLDGLISDARTRIDALDAVRQGARDTGRAARATEQAVHDTLPQVTTLVHKLSRDADTLDQILRELKDQPQSVLYGRAAGPPGPGEPGFQAMRQVQR
jgi:phospholipid/cholesterol/gamma-HCH transport system substrate-binding protein